MSDSEDSSESLEIGEQEVVPVPAVIQEQPPVPELIVPNLLNPVPVIPVRMVEEHNVTKIKIPIFNPEAPTVQARAFLALVKMARKSAGNKEDGTPKWTEEVTCTNAILSLQGSASRWIENIVEANTNELRVWADFEAAFRIRFIQPLSLIDKMNLLDLKMTSSESVVTFYDRCVHQTNLFFDEEWESITAGAAGVEGKNWCLLGQAVTAAHVLSSKEFNKRCKLIQLKLAFASGLRDSIKRLTLVQQTDSLESLLAVAQRVEASQREIRKEVMILDLDDVEDEIKEAEVALANLKFKKKGSAGKNFGQGKTKQKEPDKCFYCLKTGHYKPDCLTRKNDRAKNIFKSNIHSKPATPGKRQSANVEVDENDDQLSVSGLSVSNNTTDIQEFFQFHSVN